MIYYITSPQDMSLKAPKWPSLFVTNECSQTPLMEISLHAQVAGEEWGNDFTRQDYTIFGRYGQKIMLILG